jgi:hypothetical protein
MVPDLDKESAKLGHVSTLSVVRERKQGHLDFPKLPRDSTATSSRSDVFRLGSHVPAGMDIASMGTSTRHARRQDGTWLTDLSRQYIPSQQTSAHSTPRISSHSFLPRIRVNNFDEPPQRPLDEWTPQKSYTTPPSLLPMSGHSHATPTTTDYSPEYTRVKHEPDADLGMPPLRLGWAYVTHNPSSAHTSVQFSVSQVALPY